MKDDELQDRETGSSLTPSFGNPASENTQSRQLESGAVDAETSAAAESLTDPEAERALESAFAEDEDSVEPYTANDPVQAHADDAQDDTFEEDEEDEDEVTSHVSEEFDTEGESFPLEDSPGKSKQSRRSGIQSVKEFFNTEILYRFDLLEQNDRDAMSGTTQFYLKNSSDPYWRVAIGKDIDVAQLENPTRDNDLEIICAECDFIQLVNGKLNPQIALVSKRIAIKGPSKKASLLQNLLVPMVDA